MKKVGIKVDPTRTAECTCGDTCKCDPCSCGSARTSVVAKISKSACADSQCACGPTCSGTAFKWYVVFTVAPFSMIDNTNYFILVVTQRVLKRIGRCTQIRRSKAAGPGKYATAWWHAIGVDKIAILSTEQFSISRSAQ